MKKFLALITTLFLFSCASQNGKRNVSSTGDLDGSYLGVSKYGWGTKGVNSPATRVYFRAIPGEKDHYNVIILEYSNLYKLAPEYIAANKLPIVSKATNDLVDIAHRVFMYKAVPKEFGVYEFMPLKVVNGRLEAVAEENPKMLMLSDMEDKTHPLEGAKIANAIQKEGSPKYIYFPYKGDQQLRGLQYPVAVAAYQVANLQSTWKRNFLSGPYLAAYGRLDDVVLELTRGENENVGKFVISEYGKTQSEEDRLRDFTHPDSAHISGVFDVSEPADGMFHFTPRGNSVDAEHITGKIAVFIDIFDASISLNQKVDELIFIDPEDPRGFLMYFEHPENVNE